MLVECYISGSEAHDNGDSRNHDIHMFTCCLGSLETCPKEGLGLLLGPHNGCSQLQRS